MNPDKFPWKWSTMTDGEIRTWLLCVLAGRDASREAVVLAESSWRRGADGRIDTSVMPYIIFAETRCRSVGGIGTEWRFDFDATVKSIRRYFPYTRKDESP